MTVAQDAAPGGAAAERPAPDAPPLSAGSVLACLKTAYVGRILESYAVIDSTNRRALQWAENQAPEGALVLANEQTAGRGRLGRQWVASAGSALLMSLVLRPPMELAQVQRVTMICSLGAVEAIRLVAGVTTMIKWPNDLLITDRKVGGVLTELASVGRTLRHVVVGMGINVNLDVGTLPEVLVPPTSLKIEAGRTLSRLDLLCQILQEIETRYDALKRGWSPHEEWRTHLATLGQAVHIGTNEDVFDGTAEDVDADGALLVRLPDGEQRRVLAGDVTLRGHRI